MPGPDVRINVDPKADRFVEPLAEALVRGHAIERVCIGVFSDRRLARLRARLGPRLCTSMGPVGVARLRAASAGLPVGHLTVPCAQVPVRAGRVTIVDERLVATATTSACRSTCGRSMTGPRWNVSSTSASTGS